MAASSSGTYSDMRSRLHFSMKCATIIFENFPQASLLLSTTLRKPLGDFTLVRQLSLLSTFGAAGFVLANASYDVDHDKAMRKSHSTLYGFVPGDSVLRKALVCVSMAIFFASYQCSAVLAFTTFGLAQVAPALCCAFFGIFALYWTIQLCRECGFVYLSP